MILPYSANFTLKTRLQSRPIQNHKQRLAGFPSPKLFGESDAFSGKCCMTLAAQKRVLQRGFWNKHCWAEPISCPFCFVNNERRRKAFSGATAECRSFVLNYRKQRNKKCRSHFSLPFLPHFCSERIRANRQYKYVSTAL